MKKIYTVAPGTDDERNIAIEFDPEANLYHMTLDVGTEQARDVAVDAAWMAHGGMRMLIDGQSYDVDTTQTKEDWAVLLRGQVFERRVFDQRKLRMAQATGKGLSNNDPELKTPMAGRVVTALVEPGQAVEEGQGVVVVEAMKMENELKAHRDGVIGAIKVEPGQTVEVGAVLLTIEDAP